METFRTIVTPSSAPLQRRACDVFLAIGSCFAERIGQCLIQSRLDALVNANGILYNPFSMSTAICRLLDNNSWNRDDLIEFDGCWHSPEHHGQFSDEDCDSCLLRINERFAQARLHLERTDVLILTFGTSFVYFLRRSGQPVANCHRMPADWFERRGVGVSEIVEAYHMLIGRLLELRPGLAVILTVSPVRHLRDDACDNQLSKSRLIVAAQALAEAYTAVHYFPAYEIVMDDLRDYRFYEADMVHPNDVAIAYIWEKFRCWCFAGGTDDYFAAVADLHQRLSHRPRQVGSLAHREFTRATAVLAESLQRRFPHLDLSGELSQLAGECELP
jgi:hypothetical protein